MVFSCCWDLLWIYFFPFENIGCFTETWKYSALTQLFDEYSTLERSLFSPRVMSSAAAMEEPPRRPSTLERNQSTQDGAKVQGGDGSNYLTRWQ